MFTTVIKDDSGHVDHKSTLGQGPMVRPTTLVIQSGISTHQIMIHNFLTVSLCFYNNILKICNDPTVGSSLIENLSSDQLQN